MPDQVIDSLYKMLNLLSMFDVCRASDDWDSRKGILFTLDDCNVYRDYLERMWNEKTR